MLVNHLEIDALHQPKPENVHEEQGGEEDDIDPHEGLKLLTALWVGHLADLVDEDG